MKKFRIGDTVKLNSGGPLMTVQEITQQYDNGNPLDGYHVRCKWFDKEDVKEASFDQDALTKN